LTTLGYIEKSTVPQQRDTYSGLEHEEVQMMTECSFVSELFL